MLRFIRREEKIIIIIIIKLCVCVCTHTHTHTHLPETLTCCTDLISLGTYLHGERGGGEGAVQADRQPGDPHRRAGALEPQAGQAAAPGQHEEHRQRGHHQVRQGTVSGGTIR